MRFGILAGLELVGQIIPLMQMSSLCCWVPVKRVCLCVGGGGAHHWSQLLPVSAKSHGSHLDEAVAAQRCRAPLLASAEPLQTGLALRAPAPAFCSSAWSSVSQLSLLLRTTGTLQVLDTAHVNMLVCVRVRVRVRRVSTLLMLPVLPWWHSFNTRVSVQTNATVMS